MGYMYITAQGKEYFGNFTEDEQFYIGKAIVRSSSNPSETAREYVTHKILATTKNLKLTKSLVESVAEADIEPQIIATLESLIPEAERRAKADAVMTYLAKLSADFSTKFD